MCTLASGRRDMIIRVASHSRMRDLYLHVGYPKTGTSSVQLFLRENAAELARLGYHVPKTGQGRGGAHHALVRTLAGLPVAPHQTVAASDIIRELTETAAAAILISSEMLIGMLSREDHAVPLLQGIRVAGRRVILVVYVRNQTQWLNSAYSQSVKSFRHSGGFQPFIGHALSHHDIYAFDKWPRIAERYAVELKFRPFSREVRESGLVHDFLRTVGVTDLSTLRPAQRVNESVSPFTVEAARRLLEWLPADSANLTLLQATRCKLALAKEMSAMAITPGSYCGLVTGMARDIETRFKESNDRFSHAVWGVPWKSIFHDDLDLEFRSNDYRVTGVPADMRGPLQEVLGRMQGEVAFILGNRRLASREEWNKLPASGRWNRPA
jgi:hypothetical protein